MDIVEGWVSGATTFTWRSTTPANDGAAVEVFTRRATAAATTPEMLAAGLGATTFMPRRDLSDPEIAALAYCFAHESGTAVLPDTVRYLHERADGQTTWLQRLSEIDVDISLIWGLYDAVAPLRVANHVWQAYLRRKPGRNRYWVVPGADHYVQCDAPGEVAGIIRLTTAGTEIELQTLGEHPGGAVLVDRSGDQHG